MRTIRILLVVAVALIALGAVSPAGASRCTQYPYFMQPILCRL